MGVEAVIATQVIDTTTVGRSLMTAADAAAARTAISFDESVDDRVSALLAAGTNITITYNDAANTLTIASTASGLSGTGSVDNAALRANGTAGDDLQGSSIIINDNLTASPNNTVNHACIEATGSTTNVSVSIKPKGSGAFCLSAPDGTATGGNARGDNAVDLQRTRSAATDVATGSDSFLGGRLSSNACNNGFVFGRSNSNTSSQDAYILGNFCSTTAQYASAIGRSLTVSGQAAGCIGGEENQATAQYSFVGGGYRAKSDRYGMTANASGQFAAVGDAQRVGFQARNKTTSAVATELFLDGSSTRLTIPNGKMLSALVRVVGVKSDGSEVIKFLRDVTIKNVGGTCTVETAATTIGTDINVSAATLDVSADNSNKTLKIAVTPPAGTWRWHAIVECANEIAYGT